jgi:hypothetical protein
MLNHDLGRSGHRQRRIDSLSIGFWSVVLGGGRFVSAILLFGALDHGIQRRLLAGAGRGSAGVQLGVRSEGVLGQLIRVRYFTG